MASRKDDRGRVLKTGELQRTNKTNKKFYEYRYKDPVSGKRVSVYKPTLAELREEEKKIQKMLDTALDIQQGNRTLDSQMDLFLKTKINLREGSRKTYQTAINTIKSSSIGQTKISKITTTAVKCVCIAWYAQGLSRKYTQLCYTLLKNALQMAYEDGALTKNPCSFKLGSVLPEDEDTAPRNPITKQEKENLLAMLKKSGNPKDKFYYHVVLVLCETGLRIGEFRGLREEDINFEDMEICVHHQLSRQGTYVVPKTKHAIRKIPMTENVANSMRYLIDRAERIKAKRDCTYIGFNDFIMLSEEKGIPVDYFAYARAFRRFEREYKERYDQGIDVTPHICRHTFSSNCVAGGLPPKSLQQLMGHANFQISMNTYTDLEYDVVRNDFLRASAAL